MSQNFYQHLSTLRQQAENRLDQTSSSKGTDEILHELEIHQIELEVQYEALDQANNELQNLYQAYWNLYEFAPCGYITLNHLGRITQANQAARTLIGETAYPLTSCHFSQFIAQEYKFLYFAALQEASQTPKKPSLELELAPCGWDRLWVHLDIVAIFTNSQQVEQWQITLIDVTPQKEAAKAQKERERRQQLEAQAQRERLLNQVTTAIRQSLDLETIAQQTVKEVLQAFSVTRVLLVIYDDQGSVDLTQVASAIEAEDAIEPSALIEDHSQVRQWFQDNQIFVVDDVNTAREVTTKGETRSMLAVGICYEETLQGVLTLQICDRVHRWTSQEQQLIKQISDQIAIGLQQARMYQDLQNALQEQAQLRQKLRHDATHDQLTGLPNRTQLIDHLKEAIQRSQTEQTGFAVLFLDLNGFKQVNDTFGHTVGDKLLKIVGQRFQNSLREEDLLARFGGDEFVIFLQEITEENSAIEVATRLQETLNSPININGIYFNVRTSIGIVINQQNYYQHDAVLRDADIAMYESKNSGSDYFIFPR